MRRLPSRVCITTLALAVLMMLTHDGVVRCQADIIDYNFTTITRAQQQELPQTHWSVYVPVDSSTCRSSRLYSRPSFIVDGIGMFADFYNIRAYWYVSIFGFITPARSPMCPFFCRDTAPDTLYGSYLMDETGRYIEGGGGDWPMVALYLADMSAGAHEDETRRICVHEERYPVWVNTSYSSRLLYEKYVIVDYLYVFDRAPDERDDDGDDADDDDADDDDDKQLMAQIAVFSNGTMLLRYARVPSLSAVSRAEGGRGDTAQQPAASPPPTLGRVGVVLSKQLRIVLPTPTPENGIVAYRLDPVFDACRYDSATNQPVQRDECLQRSGCGWCAATSKCVSANVSADFCPTTQFLRSDVDVAASSSPSAAPDGRVARMDDADTSHARACGDHASPSCAPTRGRDAVHASVSADGDTSEPAAQQFYDVSITEVSVYALKEADILQRRVYRPLTDTDTTLAVPLDFYFPLFEQRGGAAQAGKRSTVFIRTPSIITLDAPALDCNPLWQACVNGNYSHKVILPMQTAAKWSPQTTLEYGYWSNNAPNGNPMCDTQPCSRGWVLRASYIAPSMLTRYPQVRTYSYVLYLDVSGTIDVVYPCDYLTSMLRDDVYAYPPVLAGVFRDGVDDPASVRVPPSMITCNTRIRYVPRTRCPDCGRHGRCNEDTGECECTLPYSGPQCNECVGGYYKSKTCVPCPRCVNGGMCVVYGVGEGGKTTVRASADAPGSNSNSNSNTNSNSDGVAVEPDVVPVCECPAGYGGVDCSVRCSPPLSLSSLSSPPPPQQPLPHEEQSTMSWLRGMFAPPPTTTITTTATVATSDAALRDGGGGDVCGRCVHANTLYCDCTTCHCKTGWSGTYCDVAHEPDACAMRSLGGSPACTAQAGCAYCSDYACYTPYNSSPGASAGGPWHLCSYDTRVHGSERDRVIDPYGQTTRATLDISFIAVIVVSVVTGVALLMIVTTCCCKQRRRRLNDPLTLVAVNAAVNYKPPPHTRMVARMQLIPPSSVPRGHYVAAIPLRQVPLDVLYARQQAARRAGAEDTKSKQA